MTDADIKEAEKKDLEFIEAEFVNVKHSTVRSIEGGHIELQQVGALSIDGERVEIAQSAAGIINGSDVYFNQGVTLVTACNNANMNYSFSSVSLARDSASVNRSAIGVMGAREIRTENSTAFLMIANRVEGEVNTLLDWKSALAVGAVLGGIFGLISIFRKK